MYSNIYMYNVPLQHNIINKRNKLDAIDLEK